jgi:hypothetical protein
MEIQSYEYRDRIVFIDFPNGSILIHRYDPSAEPNHVGRLLHKTTTITSAIAYADAYISANP